MDIPTNTSNSPVFDILSKMPTSDQQSSLQRAQQVLNDIKVHNRDNEGRQLINQFPDILKQYVIEKLSRQFGCQSVYDSTILTQKVEQARMRFQISDFFTFNPQLWDFTNLIKFISKNFSDLFATDFESTFQEPFSFQKPQDGELLNNLSSILQKFKCFYCQILQAQSDMTSRQMYIHIENMIEFFQMIASFRQNLLSQNKDQMISLLEQARVKTLMNLSKEEQANQVVRILQGPNQFDFEYEGQPYVDQALLGINVMPSSQNHASLQIIEQYESKVQELTAQLQTVQNQVQFYTINFGTDKVLSQFSNQDRSSQCSTSDNSYPSSQFQSPSQTMFHNKDYSLSFQNP